MFVELRGSSETTREILNDFNDFFVYWFVGFTEGDGSFIVNKSGYLEFKVTQSSSDAQVLFYIKKNLGFGQVRIQDKKNNTHHFRVRDKQGLLKLINIFNGRLLLFKRQVQFMRWVWAYNKLYSTGIVIRNCSLNCVTLNNAWLCGFTDAEGCFNISLVERNINYTQVFIRFMLSQQGEEVVLSSFSRILNGKLHYLKSYDGFNLVVNLSNLDNVICYFKKYNLKTKKRLVFLRWLKVYYLVKKKRHINNPFILAKIRQIMNKI